MSTDDQSNTREITTDGVKTLEQLAQSLLDMETKNLTTEQLALRSLALFPQTHVDKINVLGVERRITPIPVKYSRMVSAVLQPIQGKLKDAFNSDTEVFVDEQMLEAIIESTKILADFYKWEDVKADFAAGMEKLSTHDLQLICNTQQRVQGTNDFLLVGLRLMIKMMQLAETLAIAQGMGNQITSSTPQS